VQPALAFTKTVSPGVTPFKVMSPSAEGFRRTVVGVPPVPIVTVGLFHTQQKDDSGLIFTVTMQVPGQGLLPQVDVKVTT
jgi:hypothetical protein